MIDPAFDMPFVDYQQVGSFARPISPPDEPPNAGSMVCIGPFNAEWLPILLGASHQLVNPSTWSTPDDASKVLVLQQAEQLREIIAQAGPCGAMQLQLTAGCALQYSNDGGATWTDVAGWDANFGECVKTQIVPAAPPNPVHTDPASEACDIAGYVAHEIIQAGVAAGVQSFQTDAELMTFAQDVMASLAFAFPITAEAMLALSQFYSFYNSSTIGHFTAARDDEVLWADVTCAIYSAIKAKGYIDASNIGAVRSNICGLTYTYTEVINAICAFVDNMGLSNFRAMQMVGAMGTTLCTSCDSPGSQWCHTGSFKGDMQGWDLSTAGSATGKWVQTIGWEQTLYTDGNMWLVIRIKFPPTMVHHFQYTLIVGNYGSQGQTFLNTYLSGSLVTQHNAGYAGPDTTVVNVGVDDYCDTIELELENYGSQTPLQVNGWYASGPNPPNPFGLSNCTPW